MNVLRFSFDSVLIMLCLFGVWFLDFLARMTAEA